MHTENKELLSREWRCCCIVGALAASILFVGQHRCLLHEAKRQFEVGEEMDSRAKSRNEITRNLAATWFINRDAVERAPG